MVLKMLNWLDGVHVDAWTVPSDAFLHGPIGHDRAIDGILWAITVPDSIDGAKFCRVEFNLRSAIW